MTIFIIGPVTGRLADNRPAFEVAHHLVHDRWPNAHIIIPHELYTPDRAARVCPGLRWTEALCVCITAARTADIVVALDDWRESRGARREREECRGEFMEIGDFEVRAD